MCDIVFTAHSQHNIHLKFEHGCLNTDKPPNYPCINTRGYNYEEGCHNNLNQGGKKR